MSQTEKKFQSNLPTEIVFPQNNHSPPLQVDVPLLIWKSRSNYIDAVHWPTKFNQHWMKNEAEETRNKLGSVKLT